jgi:O-methyltransferase involved in polyketide biosynthesis
MESGKVHIPLKYETYLPTLYGKARDAHAAHPILGDTYAADVVDHIDFDFSTLKAARGDAAITLPFRAKQLDGWVRDFLARNPTATVLHLGCGLDSRVFRIDPPPTVRWYDVDLPDVIDLRRQLYPERHDYEMVGTSVTDVEWLDSIPGDRPVMVVAEGLVQYLTMEETVALLERITERFPNGEVIFDAYSRMTLGAVSLLAKVTAPGAGVVLHPGAEDPDALVARVPHLRLAETISFLTMPEMVPLLIHSKAQGWLYRRMEHWKWYRDSIRHFRYEF